MDKVWNNSGDSFMLTTPSNEVEKLENAVYLLDYSDKYGFYLTRKSKQFDFDYKLYGLETDLTNRVIKTYNCTEGNLGVLLNGVKGTGKTVTSKLIANKLNQPIILVTNNFDGVNEYLNSIPQDITILIDEYEKIFGESTVMLTIMDGALTSKHRRVFLLTTNKLYIDENLIERPGRIRYLKKFDYLSHEIVTEIVDDILKHKDLRTDCINFISNLETITVDIVKAVLNEVNIHGESPNVFSDVFNVKKLKGKYNVYIDIDGALSEFALDVKSSPRPMFSERNIGDSVRVNDEMIGYVSRVLNWTTIEVEPRVIEGNALGFSEPIILKYEDANVVNQSFAYDGFVSTIKKPKVNNSRVFDSIIKNIIDYDNFKGSNQEFFSLKEL